MCSRPAKTAHFCPKSHIMVFLIYPFENEPLLLLLVFWNKVILTER